ncbi:hypothetical protein D3C80_364440 [compost metagenome]
MSAEFGPYVQMCTLAQQMAVQYQKDTNLALAPFLKHFMDEVEVNVAADSFNHLGFMQKIREPVELGAEKASDARRKEFLQALAAALHERIQRH